MVRGKYPLAIVVEPIYSRTNDGMVRSAKLRIPKTATSKERLLTRGLEQIAILEIDGEDSPFI